MDTPPKTNIDTKKMMVWKMYPEKNMAILGIGIQAPAWEPTVTWENPGP